MKGYLYLATIVTILVSLFGTLIYHNEKSITRQVICNRQPDSKINFNGTIVFDRAKKLSDVESAILCQEIEQRIEEYFNVKAN